MQQPAPSPRDRFAALMTDPTADIALDEAALLIAAEEYEDLDVAAYLGALDDLAEAAAARLEGTGTPGERALRLNHFLFEDECFSGNRHDYYDPRNSYLNEVIDRRSGIPISLSVVYMAVADRLGHDVRGIGFPGHFLVKWMGDEEIVVDAFVGRVLSRDDCRRRLAATLGGSVALRPELHLRPAAPREILVRMLGNLKQIFVQRGDWDRALDCCERALLVVPDAPSELRDRGLVLEQQGWDLAAAADLDRFLELAPQDPSAPEIRARREALGRRLGPLH